MARMAQNAHRRNSSCEDTRVIIVQQQRPPQGQPVQGVPYNEYQAAYQQQMMYDAANAVAQNNNAAPQGAAPGYQQPVMYAQAPPGQAQPSYAGYG